MRRFIVVALVGVLGGAGCLGRGYGDVLRVHLEVLTSMADKLCALAKDGRVPTTEGMPEFIYPLKRGQQFLGYFEGEAPRDSYRDFKSLLEHYETMARLAENSRSDAETWRRSADGICAGRDQVRALAGTVAAAVGEGH